MKITMKMKLFWDKIEKFLDDNNLLIIVSILWCVTMGNCLKSPTADDISLLRGNDSQDGSETSNDPPPPYLVCNFDFHFHHFCLCSWIHHSLFQINNLTEYHLTISFFFQIWFSYSIEVYLVQFSSSNDQCHCQ